jgi:hypothetical protein
MKSNRQISKIYSFSGAKGSLCSEKNALEKINVLEER